MERPVYASGSRSGAVRAGSRPHTLRSIALACAALALPAAAQTLSVVVRAGDVVPGFGAVFTVEDLAIDEHGNSLVVVTSSAGARAVLANGAVYAAVGAPVATPPGATLAAVPDLELDETARAVWRLGVTHPALPPGACVYRGQNLVLAPGAPSSAPQFALPTTYAGFWGVRSSRADRLVVLASVSDTASSTTRGALVRCTLDASDHVLSETVVAQAGDFVGTPPALQILSLGTSSGTWSVNRHGETLYVASTIGGSPALGSALLRDRTVLVRSGDPAPVPGRAWASLTRAATSDLGDYAFVGELDGPAADAQVVCKNGATVLARTGQSTPAIGGVFTFERNPGFTWIATDDAGNVFWRANWSDPDPSRDEGIFRNSERILQEGVTTVGTETIQSFYDSFSLSRDGRYLLVGCRIGPPLRRAAVLVDLVGATPAIQPFCFGDGSSLDHTTPCPCGNIGAPGNGCANSFAPDGAFLAASGTPALDDVVLQSAHTPAAAFTLFLQHDARMDTTFHDGVLCAGGTLVRLRGRAAAAGRASFPNTSFAQDSTTTLAQRGSVTLGSGAVRYYAAWYRNASTSFCPPATANVTNGVRITW